MSCGGVKSDEGKPKMDLLPLSWSMLGCSPKLTLMLEFSSNRGAMDDAEVLCLLGKSIADDLGPTAMLQVAEVMTHAEGKYPPHNWRKGLAWSRYIAAAMRHMDAHERGERIDKESGYKHLAHALCCVLFLLDYLQTHPEFDDRYRP